MGTALAQVVADGGRPCALWCEDAAVAEELARTRRHDRIRPGLSLAPGLEVTGDLEQAVRGAEVVIFAGPSRTVRPLAARAAPWMDAAAIGVSAVKALEEGSRFRMSQVLVEETGAREVGAFLGPNMPIEILDGRPACAVVAASSERALGRVVGAIRGASPSPRFEIEIEGTLDLVGAELAAALKNVVAMAAGISHGAGLGDNAASWVVAAGLLEIERLGVALGGDRETFRGLAGVGDLFLTCTSPHAWNHEVGRRVGAGADLASALEGLADPPEGVGAVRCARELARREGFRLALVEATWAILFEDAPRGEALLGALRADRATRASSD
jgi:glycerol-3-phosphate dehydrogenase (NAD(P)+)